MRHRNRLALGTAGAAASLLAVACGGSGGLDGLASAAAPPPPPAAARPPALAGDGAVRISAVGDTILGNTPQLPPKPATYLAAVGRQLRWHDAPVVFGNLEGTLTTATDGKCGSSAGGSCFQFRNPPRYARHLHRAGFSILNDANNHSHDFGAAGLRQTVRAIHRHGMAQTGLPGQVSVLTAGATRVAVVGFAPYSDTADLLNLAAARSLIRRAGREAPVVIVYMHAGAEGSGATHVTGHEEYFVGEDRGNPERFAHLAVRNGASLVIASGPHVVRGMQFYRHRLIAYSLGNFANFHNFASGGVLSDSAILHVTLSRTGRFVSGRLLGVVLDGAGHPTMGGGTVALVRRLSREDFGRHRAHISGHGRITQP